MLKTGKTKASADNSKGINYFVTVSGEMDLGFCHWNFCLPR
jgi:hypothetical protein